MAVSGLPAIAAGLTAARAAARDDQPARPAGGGLTVPAVRFTGGLAAAAAQCPQIEAGTGDPRGASGAAVAELSAAWAAAAARPPRHDQPGTGVGGAVHGPVAGPCVELRSGGAHVRQRRGGVLGRRLDVQRTAGAARRQVELPRLQSLERLLRDRETVAHVPPVGHPVDRPVVSRAGLLEQRPRRAPAPHPADPDAARRIRAQQVQPQPHVQRHRPRVVRGPRHQTDEVPVVVARRPRLAAPPVVPVPVRRQHDAVAVRHRRVVGRPRDLQRGRPPRPTPARSPARPAAGRPPPVPRSPAAPRAARAARSGPTAPPRSGLRGSAPDPAACSSSARPGRDATAGSAAPPRPPGPT